MTNDYSSDSVNEIRIISQRISIQELKRIAEERFGDLVKAVVDIQQKIMAIGGELHADEEALLLEHGSKQADLWGINIYPDAELKDMIEFDSMINIRPRQGNRSRGLEDEKIRYAITEIIRTLLE